MNLRVEETLCSMCSLCNQICPEVFEMGDEGYAVVTNPTPGSELEAKALEAKDSCPTEAIQTE